MAHAIASARRPRRLSCRPANDNRRAIDEVDLAASVSAQVIAAMLATVATLGLYL